MAPLLFVPLDYLIAALVSSAFLPGHQVILRLGDFLLQLALGFFLLAFSRRVLWCALAQLVLMLVLYVGNAIKISFLGGPILPSDVHSLRSLFLILGPGLRFLLIATAVVFVGLLAWNFRWPRRRSEVVVAVGLLLLSWVFLWVRPAWTVAIVDSTYEWINWSQLKNYETMGATTFLVQAYARGQRNVEQPPGQEEALVALRRLRAGAAHGLIERPTRQSSVYLIVVESFWDPSSLRAASFFPDPLAPSFRRIWEAGGSSSALSPTFGGETANAELELLCGLPSTFADGAPFEYSLVNAMPCLPRLLAERGYATLAAHANVPAFWNRVSAYRRIGFGESMFESDFDLSDRNGAFLSDESFYRQALDRLEQRGGVPTFAHLMTISSHWPYDLDAERRPRRVKSASAEPSVVAYANSVSYSSQELADAIDRIRRRDPDAIIVAVGDHLPFLGENFAGYVESRVLPSSWLDFTPEMVRIVMRTPLVVIDGERGPIRVGEIPMFAIPGLILDLLGDRDRTVVDAFRLPAGMNPRPLRGGRVLSTDPEKAATLCAPEGGQGGCEEVEEWTRNAEVVWHDLLHGAQFAVPEASRAPWPPAYIAHAGGGFQRRTYTNSREALDASYARGFRFFELDFSWTADGALALIHDWDDHFRSTFAGAGGVPTRAEFLAMKRHDGLTPMTLPELLEWVRAHPDAWIVTDVKDRNLDGLAAIASQAGPLRSRFVPQIYAMSEYDPARGLGFENVIFTLYRTDASNDDVVAFAARNDLFAVTFPTERAMGTDLARRLRALGVPAYAHTVNDAGIEKRLLARGVTGLYTDFLP